VPSIPFPRDPIRFANLLWPRTVFYDRQEEIIYSTVHNDETVVVAGNKLGKDYVAGFLCLYHFLVFPVVRVVTTSIREDHLDVLWGEILRFVQTSRYPLIDKYGGPLILRHRDVRKYRSPLAERQECPISYLKGLVSKKGEGMSGHHAPHTFGVIDEASGVEDEVLEQMNGWAKRKLIFGNPNPCLTFFKAVVTGGDIPAGETTA
jgi:hypothetical protein